MAAAIREQVTLTNRMLQHLEENGGRNGNGNGYRVANGDIPRLNPQLWATEFNKMQPLLFRGKYNLALAKIQFMHIEKIFEAMACTDEQKVTYTTYMLIGESEHWWKGTKALLQAQEIPLNWEHFKAIFLEKYFLVSVKNQKETEFLQLKQGNMTIRQYVSKFKELAKFSSYMVRKLQMTSFI